ncbi:sensor histidine kinase inhibitor, KipI family [Marinospirillum celere]|uniref:Sensor histidine kinase inhibitor, KipI family n=1 Tax=Marinospirillum celere TaxID=1122252 RepID=A0A1I1E8C3_9GAMM|nr:5-oxoprolinase subunit PxpB [Marinospirillum celere]SFB81568.1 sensor histidine kinase inhibitor, KipI family [Marinospirillum celere]
MSQGFLPRIEASGLDAWMLRLFDQIDESNLAWLTALTRQCEQQLGSALVDLVPSYTTLLVVFDPLQMDPDQAYQQLHQLLENLQPDSAAIQGRLHELPTWYDESVGPDLKRVADKTGKTLEEVVALHTGTEYQVFALGFAPGFAFMGLVAPDLECPRLDTPRQRVPAGSVALTGRQTAAYPAVTPGGWNLIGRTSASLFDPQREEFSLLQVGDRVRFLAVDRQTFVSEGGDPAPAEVESL